MSFTVVFRGRMYKDAFFKVRGVGHIVQESYPTLPEALEKAQVRVNNYFDPNLTDTDREEKYLGQFREGMTAIDLGDAWDIAVSGVSILFDNTPADLAQIQQSGFDTSGIIDYGDEYTENRFEIVVATETEPRQNLYVECESAVFPRHTYMSQLPLHGIHQANVDYQNGYQRVEPQFPPLQPSSL